MRNGVTPIHMWEAKYLMPRVVKHIKWLANASPADRDAMTKKLARVKLPQVLPAIRSNGSIGINKLIRQSYAIMEGVVRGNISATTAVAAARNCDNILSGLALRARYGTDALRF